LKSTENLIIMNGTQNGFIVKVEGGFQDVTYEYNNRENLLNIPYFSNYHQDLWIRFKGCNCKNFIIKDTYSLEGSSTFDYKFDQDGYPTEVICTQNGKEEIKFIITYY